MKKLLLMTALCGTLLTPAAFAERGSMILVAPTRLVFTPGERADEVNITNVTDKHVRYRVQLVDQVMNPSGTTMIAPEGFEYSAKSMVKFMPKVVDLEPGKRQIIRVMVNKPKDLADGDYHTHMMFDEIVKPKETSNTTPAPQESGFKVEIGMSYSIGIPLVVQNGSISSTADIVSATLVKDKDGKATAIRATFTREGNAEGSLKVRALANGVDVISPRNLRVYREANMIETLLPLSAEGMKADPKEVQVKVYPLTGDRNPVALKELTVK